MVFEYGALTVGSISILTIIVPKLNLCEVCWFHGVDWCKFSYSVNHFLVVGFKGIRKHINPISLILLYTPV